LTELEAFDTMVSKHCSKFFSQNLHTCKKICLRKATKCNLKNSKKFTYKIATKFTYKSDKIYIQNEVRKM
jgi:hypothetical protein